MGIRRRMCRQSAPAREAPACLAAAAAAHNQPAQGTARAPPEPKAAWAVTCTAAVALLRIGLPRTFRLQIQPGQTAKWEWSKWERRKWDRLAADVQAADPTGSNGYVATVRRWPGEALGRLIRAPRSKYATPGATVPGRSVSRRAEHEAEVEGRGGHLVFSRIGAPASRPTCDS